MNLTEAVSTCFKKYAVFEGRASRSEYWFFILATTIGAFFCGLFDAAISVPVFYPIWVLVTFLPSVSVLVRRLHDTGRSGWLVLLYFFSFIFFIAFVVVALTWVPDWISPDGSGGLINQTSQSVSGPGNEAAGGIFAIIAAIIVAIIAIIPMIWIFVLTVLPGTSGTNKYGDDPLKSRVNTYEETWQKGSVGSQDESLKVIERLFELKQKGILSESEYEMKKVQILNALRLGNRD